MNINSSIEQKIEKYKAFYSDKSPGQIIATIAPYTFPIDYTGHEVKPLNEWDFERDVEKYVEACVGQLRHYVRYTQELDNDYIPGFVPGFGTGVNSAFLSRSPVTFGKDTSWSHSVIQSWEDIEDYRPSEDNLWLQVMLRACKRGVELCDGDYAPGTHNHFAPIDLANAMRGNQLFYDVYDEPEQVARLLDHCADAVIWLEHKLRGAVPAFGGGCVIANMWFPGNACYLSEDGADLCAPWVYTDLCRPATQKVINGVGGAYIHHHAKGAHIHKEIAKLSDLRMLELSWDPGCPRPIDMLEQVLEWTGDVPLQTRCRAEDVYRYIDVIKKGRVALMINVDSLDEGKEVMAFIRRHSRI